MDFLAGSFLCIFVGKMPRKILQENPRQNPPKFIQENPRHISAEGPGQKKAPKTWGGRSQVGMNGDTLSIKAPKECSKKFVATFKGKFLPRGNVLRICLFLLEEDFGQRKTKGQQHKGQNRLRHFSTLFQSYSGHFLRTFSSN